MLGEEECSTSFHKLPLEKKYTCIEYPGFVVNEENALKTLSAKESVKECIKEKSESIELKYNPQSVLQGVSSRRIEPLQILVKVKKTKKRPEGYKASVLGIVEANYRFTNLFDFHETEVFKDMDIELPHPTEPDEWKLDTYTDTWKDVLLPPGFCPNRRALSYSEVFRDGSAVKRVERRRQFVASRAIFVDVNDDVPTKAPDNLHSCDKEHVDNLKKIFENRPIWSRRALETYLSKDIAKNLKTLLPYVAYGITAGPWRGLWVKYGFDPKSESGRDLRIYQILDFRLPIGLLPTTKNKRVSHTFSIDKLPFKRQTVYQLVDIYDVQIQEKILSLPFPEQYDAKFGWYYSSDLEDIRARMKELVLQGRKKSATEGQGHTGGRSETNQMINSLFSQERIESEDICHLEKHLAPLVSSLNLDEDDEDEFELLGDDDDSDDSDDDDDDDDDDNDDNDDVDDDDDKHKREFMDIGDGQVEDEDEPVEKDE